MAFSHHNREKRKCFQVLGIPEGSSEDEIKKAYKKLALQHHPDKNPDDSNAKQKFQEISAAYKYLTEDHDFISRESMDPDSDLIQIFRFMFPWLFTDPGQRNYNYYYGDSDETSGDDDDNEDDEEEYYNIRQGPQISNFDQIFNFSNGAQSYAYRASTPGPRFSWTEEAAESDRSRFLRENGHFSHANEQHGQFFHEQNAKKAGKRRRKEQKRSARLQADAHSKLKTEHQKEKKKQKPNEPPKAEAKPKPEPAASSSNTSQTNSKPAKGYQPPPEPGKMNRKQRLQEQKRREKEMKEIGEELLRKEKERKEKEEQKKKAQEEKLRREREEKEEEERKEREKRQEEERKEKERKEQQEKRERERLAEQKRKEKERQAELERRDRQRRAEQERREQERREREEKKVLEERRLQKERAERDRKEWEERQRERQWQEAEKEKKRRERLKAERERQSKNRQISDLMAEFDSVTLLDNNGRFKVTDSDPLNIIRRDDINHFGHAGKAEPSKKTTEINGFKVEDLIKLQGAAEQNHVNSHKGQTSSTGNSGARSEPEPSTSAEHPLERLSSHTAVPPPQIEPQLNNRDILPSHPFHSQQQQRENSYTRNRTPPLLQHPSQSSNQGRPTPSPLRPLFGQPRHHAPVFNPSQQSNNPAPRQHFKQHRFAQRRPFQPNANPYPNRNGTDIPSTIVINNSGFIGNPYNQPLLS